MHQPMVQYTHDLTNLFYGFISYLNYCYAYHAQGQNLVINNLTARIEQLERDVQDAVAQIIEEILDQLDEN